MNRLKAFFITIILLNVGYLLFLGIEHLVKSGNDVYVYVFSGVCIFCGVYGFVLEGLKK